MENFVFETPYDFDGTQYAQLDLSGLKNLTAADLVDAQEGLSYRDSVAPVEISAALWMALLVCARVQCAEFFAFLPDRLWDKLHAAARDALLDGAPEISPLPAAGFTAQKIAAAQALLPYGELLLLKKTNSVKYALAVYASVTGKKFEDILAGSAGEAFRIFSMVRNHFFGLD
jgi:hypothetical protein